MDSRQLYSILRNVDLPGYRTLGVAHRRSSDFAVAGFPFVRWPDGKPCVAVNAYILDVQLDGVSDGTLKDYGVKLSHITRYCGLKCIGFDSLTDSDIWELSEMLTTERHRSDPTAFARNSNTVRNILTSTLNFLAWYQSVLLHNSGKILIGEAHENPQITVRIKVNEPYMQYSRIKHKREISIAEYDRSNSHFLYHRAMPEKVSSNPKNPITHEQIMDIERAIERKAFDNLDGMDEAWQCVVSTYLRSRRHFTVFIMKRTGLRPQEFIEINKDQDFKKNRGIYIPTKKRKDGLVRLFPLDTKDILRVKRYLSSRSSFVAALKRRSSEYEDPGSLLLSANGNWISAESITKDFVRIAEDAGIKDGKACLKQFRIRFITIQVAAYLQERMEKTNRDQKTFDDTDYKVILKRISELLGHKSEKSLWSYVRLGWDYLGLWNNIDKTRDRINCAERFYEELMDLKYDIQCDSSKSAGQVVDFCTDRLGEILGDARLLTEDK